MKKYFLLLAILFTGFAQASYDPAKECEELKADYTAQIRDIKNLNGSQRNDLQGLGYQLDLILSNAEQVTNHYYDANSAAVVVYANSALDTVGYLLTNNATNDLRLTQLLTSVRDIDCSQCSTVSTNCCDFSQIISMIGNCVGTLTSIEHYVIDIQDAVDLIKIEVKNINTNLTYTNFLLEHGFNSITNMLLGSDENINLVDSYRYLSAFGSPAINDMYWPLEPYTIGQVLYTSAMNENFAIGSLNNYAYDFLNRIIPYFGHVTDNLIPLTSETTNFFSFFRGEIGVNGVLADWNPSQGVSYHDFLTNHYLTVVRGGSLSGNQSSKTNWFSRIETLLAALVFTDTTETNTVDTSAGNTERQQLATSYGTANQAAATFSEDFKTTSQSIVTLYQNYFTTFENASMPSHVVLMRLSNSDPSEEVEIAFQSDSLGILVESCRVVTTLCWSSVGIFLLYKFLVWSARCVIVACQFIYRAISSVFRS